MRGLSIFTGGRRAVWVFIGVTGVPLMFAILWLGSRLLSPTPLSLARCAAPGRATLLAHGRNGVGLATEALQRGFCGFEVDVQWKDSVGLVIAHDPLPPTWTPAGATTLPGLLDSLPQQPRLVWLDFKNLSPENAHAAALYIHDVVRRHSLEGRVVVEGRRWRAVAIMHRELSEAVSAYWIPRRPRGRRGIMYDTKLAIILASTGLRALSVPRKELDPVMVRRFGRVALFTWTFNEPDSIRFAERLGARIILTDAKSPAISR